MPTQGWNPGLLHCRRILYQLNRRVKPYISADTTKFADCLALQRRDKAAMQQLPRALPSASKADKRVFVARQSHGDSLKVTPESGFAPCKPLSNSSVFFTYCQNLFRKILQLIFSLAGTEALAPHSFLNNGNYHHILYVLLYNK